MHTNIDQKLQDGRMWRYAGMAQMSVLIEQSRVVVPKRQQHEKEALELMVNSLIHGHTPYDMLIPQLRIYYLY